MTQQTNTILRPGQVDFKKCEIVNYKGEVIDISLLIAEFNLFEDLFANSLSGNIVVSDTNDLISSVPLLGEELLEVEFTTPSLTTTIKRKFYIYKLSDRTIQSDRSQSYVLHFTTTETIVNLNRKISKSYKGLLSDSATEVLQKYLQSTNTIFVEPSKNAYDFIACYWTPYETLNFCAQRALNEKGAANYFFFETNQSYEFVSVDKLVSLPIQRSYVFSNVDSDTLNRGDIEAASSMVRAVYADTHYDYIKRTTMGMYGSKLVTFDLTSKVIQGTNFDYLDSFLSYNHLDKFPITSKNLVSRKLANLYFQERVTKYNATGAQYDKFYQVRNSLTEQISAYKLNIEVPGRTDLKVGHCINFSINNFKQLGALQADDIVDDVYSGKYLITAIRHKIQGAQHTMYLEIVKDSFIKELV